MELEDVEKNFSTHALSLENAEKVSLLREEFKVMARRLCNDVPRCPERTIALRKLEELSFYAIAAISRNP